jgi:hypothetical protein
MSLTLSAETDERREAPQKGHFVTFLLIVSGVFHSEWQLGHTVFMITLFS